MHAQMHTMDIHIQPHTAHAHVCTHMRTYTSTLVHKIAHTSHVHTQLHTMQHKAVSIHCREKRVYQALELPWDCRGGGPLRYLSPFNGCRNLLSPQPSFCQSPSVKE